jgi:hypothetical protein
MRWPLLCVLVVATTAQAGRPKAAPVEKEKPAKPAAQRRLTKAEVEKIIETIPNRPNMAKKGASPIEVDAWFKSLSPKQRQAVDQYCAVEDNAYTGVCGGTPLVAQFSDGPVTFGSVGAFAFTPGAPVTTAWPTSPWIARDLDHSGCIENGAELFGSNTRLPDGTLARDGFEALAVLDRNHDGVVDARDPGFDELVLWSNAGDRVCRPGELRKLSSVVSSISLEVAKSPRRDEVGRSVMSWRDDRGLHTGAVVDVFLRERPLSVARR